MILNNLVYINYKYNYIRTEFGVDHVENDNFEELVGNLKLTLVGYL